MQTFLSEVVQSILNSGHSLAETICVLPSERAGVFLKEAFKKQIGRITFLPEIISIENFIEQISGLKKIETVPLLFEFYQVYVEHTPGNKDDFDSFSHWASVALQDFNELDRHLVASQDLFSYLKDIKRLESWDVKGHIDETSMMSNHFYFMERLGLYYEAFYQYLIEHKKGYQGLLYRESVEKAPEFIQKIGGKKIVLIGFNALNKAEENLFTTFLESGKAAIYWDSDAYYMHQNKEAGVFLRRYKSEWPYFDNNSFQSVANNFSKEKKIYEIAASKNVSQVKAVGALLASRKNLNNTALVLAEESLLSLTLNSLPENVDKLNITMGYFLKDMPIAGFFDALFTLYLTQKKLNKTQENSFYYKDVFRVLEHPFSHKLFGNSEQLTQLKTALITANKVFISSEDFKALKGSFSELSGLEEVFEMTQNVKNFLASSTRLIVAAKDNFSGFERECLYRYYNLFVQLENLNGTYEHIRTINTLHAIYKQLISTEKLSFQGEPLSGLQLMGVLETRVLDFETVIITSMNEGVLPAGKSENSFIPFDVKKEYGLPTYHEKDAIFSYHFYRLLQRAKTVFLLYNTETDAYGAGERSRFLTQLEMDGFNLVKKSIAPKVVSEETTLLSVDKTPEMIQRLQQIAKRGFSPSALSKYVEDPVAYYKRYILGIKDVEEIDETIASNTLGTVVHEVLDGFYTPYVGKFLTLEALDEMRKNTPKETESQFKKIYKNGHISSGKNKLILKVAERFILNFLASEKKLLQAGTQLKILGTEQEIAYPIRIKNQDKPIYIKGTVDRIDSLDGVVRIVDYKSGKVDAKQLQVDDFEKTVQDYSYTKALQVMLYAFLYTSKNPALLESGVQAGIYSFRNTKGGFLSMNFGTTRKKDTQVTVARIEDFMEVIKSMLHELFDINHPFIQNPDRPDFNN
ncbi:MAG: PD-(D/E)XK nuclease family protein [Flavicella sp.]